ncbi:MFS transporter [Hydrogenophaga palleronii]|uniref:MFS transporter n=1 Tax=Hydrogenophaga palleronii TaxID=65655 RepID=UPI0008244F48|nr:MFS transporter [Hydrogenophaga palleronii]
MHTVATEPSNTAVTATDAFDPSFRSTVWSLGVGGFAIGTGEFVIMGLLPEVAADLGVSIPQAGHVISAYALGVVVGAPLLAVVTAHWPRRLLLVALMALFALGTLASAAAPGYLSLNLLRFAAGMPHGTYFGVASLVVASLAPPGRRAHAVAMMMLGLTGATLFGVPAAAWLGQHLGWRSAFVLVGVIALLACVLVHRALPRLPAAEGASPLRELGALTNPQVWLTLGTGAVGFGGMFAVFSYIKPTLTEVSGLSLGAVPLVLALFGVGMILGNLVGARLADKALLPTIGGTLVWSMVVLLLMLVTAPHAIAVSFNVLLVGTVVALAPALQIRLMDVAGEAQALAAALNHSAFNMANALGAWLGGAAITAGMGWTSTGWVGALLAAGGLVVFGASIWQQQRRSARPVAVLPTARRV